MNEPTKCPTCGSTDKHLYMYPCDRWATDALHHYDDWHRQPEAPPVLPDPYRTHLDTKEADQRRALQGKLGKRFPVFNPTEIGAPYLQEETAAPPDGVTVILSSAASMPDEIMPTAKPEGESNANSNLQMERQQTTGGNVNDNSAISASPALSASFFCTCNAVDAVPCPIHKAPALNEPLMTEIKTMSAEQFYLTLKSPPLGINGYGHGGDEAALRRVFKFAEAYADHKAAALTAERDAEIERLTQRLAAADAYFPEAALAKVNAEERAEKAEARVAKLEAALREITDGFEDCDCTCRDELCCVKVKEYCPRCMARAALASTTPPSGEKGGAH